MTTLNAANNGLAPPIARTGTRVLANTRAVTILTIYIALLMFIPSDLVWSPLGGAGSPATVFAVGVLGWYLVHWCGPSGRLCGELNPVRTAAILLACAVLASYVSANRGLLPILERNAADRGLISMAGWLGVLLMATDALGTWGSLQILIKRIVACGSAVAGIGVVQFITGVNLATFIVIPGLITKVQPSDLLVRDGFNRPSATAAHPLELAAVLAMCLPLALHRARYAPSSRFLSWRWAQVAVIAAALPMTISRSAILGLAAVAVTLLPTWPRRDRWVAYSAALGSAALVWLAKPDFLTVFLKLFGAIGSDPSTESRLSAFASAAPYVTAHPWFGMGFQTFLPQVFFFVDNQYLTTAIETGFVGLIALVGVFCTGWIAARSARSRVPDVATRDLLQCLAASTLVAAVSFYTFDAMSFSIATGLTFVVLGCVGAGWRISALVRSHEPGLGAGTAEPATPTGR
jgi:O-antigen ligase